MIKIFYKKDYERVLEEKRKLEEEKEKQKENYERRIADINEKHYQEKIEKSENYNPDEDPVVLKDTIKRLKADHQVEIESYKSQLEDKEKEIKVVKADKNAYKKEKNELIKEKANWLKEKANVLKEGSDKYNEKPKGEEEKQPKRRTNNGQVCILVIISFYNSCRFSCICMDNYQKL